jgi:hypothetical protein
MRPSKLRLPLKNRRDHEPAFAHFRGNVIRQRTAVADARRAAVADGVEANLIEIDVEARALQIVGHHLRTRRQAGLHPRLRVRPFSTARFATRPAPIMTLGFDVLVQLVIAAMTTDPCSS